MNRQFAKEEIQTTYKHEKVFTSLGIKAMHINDSKKHFIPSKF